MPKNPFQLTLETYYSPDRPHVSRSQIVDYLKSPEFYKLKHIDHAIPKGYYTCDWQRGLIVDHILTRPEANLILTT